HVATRHDLALRVKRDLLVGRQPVHGGVGTAGECHEGTAHHHGPTPTCCVVSHRGRLLARCRSTGSRTALIPLPARSAGGHRPPWGRPRGPHRPSASAGPCRLDDCYGFSVLNVWTGNGASGTQVP